MKKRILAAALALMMLVTAMPVFAAAASISKYSGSNSFVWGAATRDLVYKVNPGTGTSKCDEVEVTFDCDAAVEEDSSGNFVITIAQEDLNALDAGEYTLTVEGYREGTLKKTLTQTVTVREGSHSKVTVTSGSTSFDYQKATKDLIFTVTPGTGLFKATGIDDVVMNGESVGTTDGLKITIEKDYLNSLVPGKYDIDIYTAGGEENEELKTSVLIKATGTKSYLVKGTNTKTISMERGAATADLELTLKPGTGTYIATGVTEAFIGETEVAASGTTVTVTKEELNALPAGTHTVKATTTGAIAAHDAEFTIKVTEPQQATVSPTAVNVTKGSEKDLVFTVTPGKNVNKAVTYSAADLSGQAVTLTAGDPSSTTGKFKLTLAKEDLQDLDPGKYTLTIELENEDGTAANSVAIEINIVASAPVEVYSDTLMMPSKTAKSITFKLANSYGSGTKAYLFEDEDCNTESTDAEATISGSNLTIKFDSVPDTEYVFYVVVDEKNLEVSAPVAITVLPYNADGIATLKEVTYIVSGIDTEDLAEIEFDPQIENYEIELPYKTALDAEIKVTATPTDSEATVIPSKSSTKTNIGYKEVELVEGTATVQFAVESKDTTVSKLYTFEFKVKEIEKVDWEAVIEDIEAARTTGTIDVDMYLDTVIPEEVLLALKGTKKTLRLNIDDESYWLINGQDITAADRNIKDTDIGFELDNENISATAILNKFGKVTTTELEFIDTGAFGFSGTLELYLGSSYMSKFANLYTYSAKDGFTLVAVDEISLTGLAEFILDTGDVYLIVIDSKNHSVKPMTFTDVPTSAWYYADVAYAYGMGLIDGMNETTFDPNGNLTIGQAIKLAACMHQFYYKGEVTLVPGTTNWYTTYVAYALANGIIASEYPNYYKPATRAEMAVIFANVLPSSQYEPINTVNNNAIPDVKITDTYGPAVYKLYRAGILAGNNSTTRVFTPETNIRRCEVAAILTRLMNHEARQEFTLR